MSQYTLYRAYYKQRRPSGSTQSWQDVLPLTISYTDGSGHTTVISQNSPQCGYEPQPDPQYRWVNISINQDYECDTTTYTKYYKQKRQVSYDNGATWNDVSPAQYQRGEVYENQSIDCGYVAPTGDKYIATYGGNAYSDTQISTKNCYYSIFRDEIRLYYYENTPLRDNLPLTSLVIGDCVQVINPLPIRRNAPSGADNYLFTLTSLTISSSVTSIGSEAFAGGRFSDCGNLSSVTYIGKDAFNSCPNLTGVTFGDRLEQIDSGAFARCVGLTSVTIPDSVTYIGSTAFGSCSGLTSVKLPNALTIIKSGLFHHCSSLTSITIPSTVTEIERAAFSYCEGLTGITCLAVNPPTLSDVGQSTYSAFLHTNNCPIYVPAASVNAYKTATKWSTYADRIFPIGS